MHRMTKEKLYKWWYALCFVFLGIIDQRRGSALGTIQMTFTNLTGVVMALLLLPSIKFEKEKAKPYLLWTPVCVILAIIACIIGNNCWQYKGQWITAVLNISVWSYLIIYVYQEKSYTELFARIKQPVFWCTWLCLVLMQLSVHEGIVPLWYLLIYGGFAVIGIPKERTEDFFDGMMTGIILWFFGQQIIAFGFRPYDYVRYRGLYSGETQNGLFYMIAFCAFLLKWIDSREKERKWYVRFFYFLMSAGMVSFTSLTGGKAPILGIGAVIVFVYIGYDIFKRKTFYGLVLHSVTLVLCIVLTFPATYLCIRYLPTILHHPVWFEGEYVEGESVCSFDSWNSEKYISFTEVIHVDIARYLRFIGIQPEGWNAPLQSRIFMLPTYAKESNELEQTEEIADMVPGSSPDNPFDIENVSSMSPSTNARKVIYTYYWNNLNFEGHDKNHSGFWISRGTYYGHAHNMFLQVAYDYGIIPGILFVLIYLYSLYRAFLLCRKDNWICMVFLLAILCFGMVEMVLVSGQITVPLMAIMFYFVGRDGYTLNVKGSEAADETQ